MNKLLFIVLVAFQLNAQDTIVFPKIDTYKRNIMELSYGFPQGNLASKFEKTINTGIYFRTKIAKQQFIDFGAELSGIIKGKNINYNFNNQQIVLDGSKTSFLLGLRYTVFLFRNQNTNFHIETNSGAGWTYMHYRKPEVALYDDVDLKPSLHTIALTQGVKVMFHGVGLLCNYRFAPYSLFNPNAGKDFGNSIIHIGISGSWNF